MILRRNCCEVLIYRGGCLHFGSLNMCRKVLADGDYSYYIPENMQWKITYIEFTLQNSSEI